MDWTLTLILLLPALRQNVPVLLIIHHGIVLLHHIHTGIVDGAHCIKRSSEYPRGYVMSVRYFQSFNAIISLLEFADYLHVIIGIDKHIKIIVLFDKNRLGGCYTVSKF